MDTVEELIRRHGMAAVVGAGLLLLIALYIVLSWLSERSHRN